MISTTLIDVVNTIREKTDQCCPYGNSTPGHSAMKMNQFQSSLHLLIVGVFEKISVESALQAAIILVALASGKKFW